MMSKKLDEAIKQYQKDRSERNHKLLLLAAESHDKSFMQSMGDEYIRRTQ